MERFTSSPVRIAFDDLGSGPTTLLLLPGWGASRAMYARVAPILAKDHRVLAMDWRGHGASDRPDGDFGMDALVTDAMEVIATSGAERIVPVAAAHAGFVALDLLTRLGRERIASVALVDWIVLDPPPPFLGALAGLQDPAKWEGIRAALFTMWLGGAHAKDGSEQPDVARFLREDMATYDHAMWSRAAREIARAYEARKRPLDAFASLGAGVVPVLHAYAQPRDEGYLEAQRAFAAAHPWFSVRHLDGVTHFPMLESPEALAAVITEHATRASK
jgi:pimeloyl-ACP methyl ester carboxylesterase